VLSIILASNYLDRVALGLLLQDIKIDLSLSDTQLGLLTGIAFALFYAVMGVPIARWSDRGNRVTIISLTTALWGAAVALCAAATSFVHLLLIRIVIGIGEAGCKPPAMSLISDYFDRAERPRAVSRYLLGSSAAWVIGYFSAGWLNEIYGWRMTFVILGLPGVALSLLAYVTLKEPRLANRASGGPIVSAESKPSMPSLPPPTLREVFGTLWGSATFRHLLFCFSLVSFFSNGISLWLPAFFVRSYGLETGELGSWLAVIVGLGGIAGTYLGGEFASRLAPSNERLQLMGIGVMYAILAVFKAGVYMAPNYYIAFLVLAVQVIFGALGNGPIYAATQTLVPERMRAMSIAIILFASNLIGVGFGPLAAGMLSDALHPAFGDESLRYALLTLCPGYLWAGWHAICASRTVPPAGPFKRPADSHASPSIPSKT
jgi:MFS transporter, Spinster family, sphingosine-1-phosphate transporter